MLGVPKNLSKKKTTHKIETLESDLKLVLFKSKLIFFSLHSTISGSIRMLYYQENRNNDKKKAASPVSAAEWLSMDL